LEHESIVSPAEPGFFSQELPSASLEKRLERGWRLMCEREDEGLPTDELFVHFQMLLSDYEAACHREAGQLA
jgi:hypothetical protein